MLIRIINLKNRTERRTHAEIVDFDREYWLITINGKVQKLRRKDYEVLIFA